MKTFNKGSKFGKRDSGKPEGRRFGRSNDGSRFESHGRSHSRPSESFEAICSKCGKKCDLPFKPTGYKPVYCKSCFRENSSSESRVRPNNFDRNPSHDRFETQPKSNLSSDELEKINQKLDKIMRALKIE